jgi:iron complex outermembrane receptor protein
MELFSSRNKIIPTAPYGTVFGDPGNRYIDARGSLEAAWSHDLSNGAQIDFRGYYDYYRFLGGFPYAASSPDQPIDFFWNEGNNHWIGSELVYGQRVGKHRVVFGTSVEHNLQLKQTNYYPGQRPFFEDRRNPTEIAVFGELELNPTRHWSINAGGRFDWQSIYGHAIAPRLAVMYFPTRSTSLKYIYNQAFRAPNPYDEFYVNAGFVDLPNPRLMPEHIGTHTFLVEHDLSKHVHIAGNAFLVSLQKNIGEQVDSSGASFFANADGDSGHGVEGEISADARGWSSRASYTFSRTRDGDTHLRLENSPGHIAKVNGTMPIRRYGWLGAELFSSSAQISYNGIRSSPFILTNATISTPVILNGLQIAASCYDLFDRRWATPTGPEVTAPATTQNGRTWRVTITFRHNLSRREH